MFKRYVYVKGLIPLVGSNGEYLINILGQIKDVYGNDLPTTRDANNDLVVRCEGWDGERDYRVMDLMVIQFKGLYIPREKFGEIVAFAIDGDRDNCHAKNIGYRFKCGKLEVEGFPGFYYVPSSTRVAVNIHGEALDVMTKTFRKWTLGKSSPKKGGNYRRLDFRYAKGMVVNISRHRAVCLVFKDYPNNVDSLVVNHIDGVPGHDWLDNLEIVTNKENTIHAYLNNLNTCDHRVLTRDVFTGEVKEYLSLSECARDLGYTIRGTLTRRLFKCPFSKVFRDGKQFKLKDDSRDWIIPSDPHKAVKDAISETPMIVRNCLSLEEDYYPTIGAAARATDISSPAIQYRLSVDNMSPLFGYQFKKEEDPRDWQPFTEEEYLKSLVSKSLSCEARNLFTGEKLEFPSFRKTSEYFGTARILSELTPENCVLLESGWQIKTSNAKWVEVEEPEKVCYELRKGLMAREEATGKIIVADSATQMGYLLKLDRHNLMKAAKTRGNRVYNGYRFILGTVVDEWLDIVK